jgi:hypothetical protein
MGIETTSETWDKTRTACFGSLLTPVLSNLFNPSSNPRSGRLARIYKYLAVPGGLVSYCKYLSSTRCMTARVKVKARPVAACGRHRPFGRGVTAASFRGCSCSWL